jgi:hypothetical protein
MAWRARRARSGWDRFGFRFRLPARRGARESAPMLACGERPRRRSGFDKFSARTDSAREGVLRLVGVATRSAAHPHRRCEIPSHAIIIEHFRRIGDLCALGALDARDRHAAVSRDPRAVSFYAFVCVESRLRRNLAWREPESAGEASALGASPGMSFRRCKPARWLARRKPGSYPAERGLSKAIAFGILPLTPACRRGMASE